MSDTSTIDLPHSLGREEAKRRLQSRVGDIAKYVPGGVADVRSSWPAEDRMALTIDALGQHIALSLDVEDALVRVSVTLPPSLGFMRGMIGSAIRDKGGKLLASG